MQVDSRRCMPLRNKPMTNSSLPHEERETRYIAEEEAPARELKTRHR